MNGLDVGQSVCFVVCERRRFIVREQPIACVYTTRGHSSYRFRGYLEWFPSDRVFTARPDAVDRARALNEDPTAMAQEASLRR